VSWLDPLIPHLKTAHVGFLALWVAGLFALPRMLARHDPAIGQADFTRIRQATHYGYVWAITPAAVLAIASGTTLIFLREVFTGWMFAKLVFVGGLVAVHAWVGHTIVKVAETEGHHQPPEPLVPTLALLIAVLGILALVLAKPELEEVPLPAWLLEPRGGQLPFDVPRR
jgi:uncharacterized membrane protein